jgi:hypothetical protein
MTDIAHYNAADVPSHVTHHERGRRVGIASRLQAAFGAFLAPERLRPASNDNDAIAWTDQAASLADPLALPPDWHGTGGDLLSLSFLPFDR